MHWAASAAAPQRSVDLAKANTLKLEVDPNRQTLTTTSANLQGFDSSPQFSGSLTHPLLASVTDTAISSLRFLPLATRALAGSFPSTGMSPPRLLSGCLRLRPIMLDIHGLFLHDLRPNSRGAHSQGHYFSY